MQSRWRREKRRKGKCGNRGGELNKWYSGQDRGDSNANGADHNAILAGRMSVTSTVSGARSGNKNRIPRAKPSSGRTRKRKTSERTGTGELVEIQTQTTEGRGSLQLTFLSPVCEEAELRTNKFSE